MSASHSLTRRIAGWLWGRSAAGAGVEFALVLPFLLVPIINIPDLAIYTYQSMEVNAAAQAAAEAALVNCGQSDMLPATRFCPVLIGAETRAAQATSLGTAVTVTSTTEGFYCVDSTGKLTEVATASQDEPVDCTAVKNAKTNTPGDYVQVSVSFTYRPVFAVSIASILTTPITRTHWMRVG